jgi:hypothetical protein
MARSACIYGSTGSRKTTQLKYLAHYIAKTTGKSMLLLSCDGGGWAPCQPEVDAGMILPYRVETSTIPLAILRNISRGYWPEDASETRPHKINLRPIDWTQVGGVGIEGWTSISQVVMRYLPDAGISVGGEERNKLGGFSQDMYVEGEIKRSEFRSNTRGDYGFVQNFLYGLVMNFGALPCAYVCHTALESKTEDDDRSTTFGPAISGKKATAQCGAWVGDLIHAQDYSQPRTVKVPDPADPAKTVDQVIMDMTVRFHYKKHPDPATGVPFPAKPRVTPEQMGALEKRFPGGYFEPTADGHNTFATYLEEVDRLSASQGDTLKGWREKMDEKLGRKVSVAQTQGGGK